jgi:hypothetical protein
MHPMREEHAILYRSTSASQSYRSSDWHDSTIAVADNHNLLDGTVSFANQHRYNWTTQPDIMAHTWRACIAANKGKPDFIWTVGMRGLWDYQYCPGYYSTADCGECPEQTPPSLRQAS